MKKTLLALSLISASTSVMAKLPTLPFNSEPLESVYGGLSINQANISGEKAGSYGAHVGTGMFPILGRTEVGYWNHGSFKNMTYSGTELTDVNAHSFYLAAKPAILINYSSIYVKLGLTSTMLDGKKDTASYNDNAIGFMYGVGYDLLLFEPLSLGASYQSFMALDENIHSFTFNATLHFF